MGKIDTDKFIYFLIKRYCEVHNIDRSQYKCWLDKVLEDCGFEYKNEKLIPLKTEWIPQSRDRIRKKGTIKPIYVLCSKTDLGFNFVEEREIGIAGGELNFCDLRENYELVERPKTIEEAIDELFKPLTDYINNKN